MERRETGEKRGDRRQERTGKAGCRETGRGRRHMGTGAENRKIEAERLSLYYGTNQALKQISMEIRKNTVTALIGPSGCGKSTFLRCFNRMNDQIENMRVEGRVYLDGQDIYDRRTDVTVLRKRVGMVFQQPTPFPMSIYDNVAYGPRLSGKKDRQSLDGLVERALRGAALYEEVKDKLRKPALGLSG